MVGTSFPSRSLRLVALLVILHLTVCEGQLTFSSGYIIEGQPITIFCRIPNFNGVAHWIKDDEQFTATTCSNSGFCKVENEGTRYKYASNVSGISVTISNIDRIEERDWKCGHPGYVSAIYRIRYNDNVFVISDSVVVDGLDRNVTLGDDISTVTLTFTTGCMHPYPIVAVYSKHNTNTSITSEIDYVNVTSTTCTAPEAGYTGAITIYSDSTCNTTLFPQLLITPTGLPLEYSTTEWMSSYYIKFPTCKDEQTSHGLAHSTQSDYVTTTVNYVTTLSVNDSTTQSEDDQATYQELSSSNEKIEMAVGISVGCVVFLIILLYIIILVFKRKKSRDQNLFDNLSQPESHTQSLVPSIISVDQFGNDYDVDFNPKMFPGMLKSSNPTYQAEACNNEMRTSTEHEQMASSEIILSPGALDMSAGELSTCSNEADKCDSGINSHIKGVQQSDHGGSSNSGDEITFVLKM
ncbi:unnamed protein product [Mytilus coruscus]|uniref:Mid2 domain-containing protein n=1 Tax=Mytilus coruscus TaxID=42192 RepID=A0A6J8BU89_MYTCO|nr:unnamed protein product [Mytilus coruscus]